MLDRQFILFCLVGGSGFLLNVVLFHFLQASLQVPVLAASFGSAFIAMVSNFLLNNSLTWPGEKKGTIGSRFIKYFLVSLCGIGINMLVLYILNRLFQVPALPANIIGILTATGWNFLINRYWTFRKKQLHTASRPQNGRV